MKSIDDLGNFNYNSKQNILASSLKIILPTAPQVRYWALKARNIKLSGLDIHNKSMKADKN